MVISPTAMKRTLLESTPLSPIRWDEERGLFLDFKILGLESANGRRYTPEALRRAVPLYEGKVVNCDHPGVSAGRPGAPTDQRSVYDRLGKFLNVRFVEGDGLRGDLKPFRTHEMFPRLQEAITDPELLDCLCFSHNADGRGHMEGDIFVVDAIEQVRSVDLVADGATTRSLIESRKESRITENETKTLPVRQVLDRLTVNRRLPLAVRRRLLEAMDDGCLKEQVLPGEGDEAPVMTAPEEEPEQAEDPMAVLKDGFVQACLGLLHDALDGDDEAWKKLDEYIKAHRKIADKNPEPEEEDHLEEEEEEDEEDGAAHKKDASEGKKQTSRGLGLLEERLAKIEAHLASLHQTRQAQANRPRSSAPGGVLSADMPLQGEAFLKALCLES
jgi:hypothetical protein